MTRTVNTRELILEILLDITKNGAYSHIAAGGVLDKYQYLDKKDRAFITRVTEGTLEQRIQIDYVIDQFSKVKTGRMKPAVRCIIQSGVYQILFMDGVPDAAACNEAVRLARKKGFQNLSGFVNGVLRNISRRKDSLQLPDQKKEPHACLSVRYSIPEWMIRMWEAEFSLHIKEKPEDFEKMERMLRVFQTPAPLTIRTDTRRITPQQLCARLQAEGVDAQPSEQMPEALQITGCDHLRALPGFAEGLFYVQDLSSMSAVQAVRPKENDFIVDVCAAPGGKAVYLAQMLNGTGQVLARDLTEYKASLLRENMQRCRVENMQVQVWDARILDETLVEKADLVTADLPCSGLGVMRRKKDIRYNMTPEKMSSLVKLQREILSVVCRYVKPGGRLLYSTCTIHREENEGNADWFAGAFPQFRLITQRQILPGEAGGDGFYFAVFQNN